MILKSVSISDCVPAISDNWPEFIRRTAAAGYVYGTHYHIECTARLLYYQIAKWCQGRMPNLADVNMVMAAVGMDAISAEDNVKVTNAITLSRHVVPVLPTVDYKSSAFDITVLVNGKPTWAESAKPIYLAIAKIGEDMGVGWYGGYHFGDYPHIQVGPG